MNTTKKAFIFLLCLGTIANGFAPADPKRHGKVMFATTTGTVHSELLGDITPIQLSGEEEDSFLSTNAVPTFASISGKSRLHCTLNANSGGLEGVIRQRPAFVVDGILSQKTCDGLITLFEELGFGTYKTGKNHHGALQIVVSPEACDSVAQALSSHINVNAVNERRLEFEEDAAADVRLTFAGLNRRWRVYRYIPCSSQTFAPHIDAGFPPSIVEGNILKWDATDYYNGTDIVGRLTVLMYLNDDFTGGETNFFSPASLSSSRTRSNTLLCSVRPQTGSMLVFPQAVGEGAVDYARKHWPLHEGSPVTSGNRPKYVIRSDILFAKEVGMNPENDPYSRHDIIVRKTFLPQSSVLDSIFLAHIDKLYNPHMGVENFGPLIYSLIRFTKKRNVVEIGAGYTSLWILQALRDNDDELERIRLLGREGKCLLLDTLWAVPDIVEAYDAHPASLMIVDNCRHQKETATEVSAVAKTLGLEKNMRFVKGDAFDLSLPEHSVDLLWCDFGVGSRMAEFCKLVWCSLRPGGFLLCHSSLTNQATREWLEAVRSGQHERTGLPPDSYVELSLLEPHKRYQNAVTVLQKRSDGNGKNLYEEPIYSLHA